MSDHNTVSTITAATVGAAQSAPLYSSQPAAGFPAPGDDEVEASLDLNDLLIDHPEATFFVKVQGDSMIDAGIFDGDILVIDRAVEALSGKIVVAAVYGELVVKQLIKTADGMALVSANEAYKPIQINEKDDVYVWGVVIGSVRVF